MKRAILALLVLLLSAPASAATVEVSVADGRVTIKAQDATVRQILAEWARVGRVDIVNLERVTSGPITLLLENVPEKEALGTVLRNVPGYVAAPRTSVIANASIYDRILIMATTTAPPPAATAQAPAFGGFSQFSQPNITQLRLPPAGGAGAQPPADVPDPGQDPAIAAAAAAGLVAVPAAQPGMTRPNGPLQAPAAAEQGTETTPAPAARPPSNPWNAPAGTDRPSAATPVPPPPPTGPTSLPPNQRPRTVPTQPD